MQAIRKPSPPTTDGQSSAKPEAPESESVISIPTTNRSGANLESLASPPSISPSVPPAVDAQLQVVSSDPQKDVSIASETQPELPKLLSNAPSSADKKDLESGSSPPNDHESHCQSSCFKSLGGILKNVFTVIGAVAICSAIVSVVLLPDIIFGTYAYYINYTKVYPGTKAAFNVSKNKATGTVFQLFYWTVASLASSYNFFLIWLALKQLKDLALCVCLLFLPALALGTLTLWIRPLIENGWHSRVWENGCQGWDFHAILATVDLSSVGTTFPTHVGNITIFMANLNLTMQLIHQPLNPYIFDMVTTSNTSINSFLPYVSYNIKNLTYTIPSTDSKNITSFYVTSPNLAFPSLNLSLADPSIPWVRPNAYTCWPPAANLFETTASSGESSNVLRTITLKPGDCTQMEICGSGIKTPIGFQIALGVISIEQFRSSLCCTGNNVQQDFGVPDLETGDSSK